MKPQQQRPRGESGVRPVSGVSRAIEGWGTAGGGAPCSGLRRCVGRIRPQACVRDAGRGYALVGSGRAGWAAALTSPCAAFSSAALWDAMEQALASPGLFSDDDGAAAASPVLESTATGFGADVRKDLLSEFSAISPNLEGSQQVRLEQCCVLHAAQNGCPAPLSAGALEKSLFWAEQLLLPAAY